MEAPFCLSVAVAHNRDLFFCAGLFGEIEQLGVDGFKFRVRMAPAAHDRAFAKALGRQRDGAAIAFPMRQMSRVSAYSYCHKRGTLKERYEP